MYDLNNLISPNSGWTLTKATAINASGDIVGYGVDPNGGTEAFLLTPAPEPAALGLFALGAVGLLLKPRRAGGH
jgi:probable HAF family extracellular repeat protein